MSIIYRYIPPETPIQPLPIATVRIVGEQDIEAFKQLVRRGLNTWDDAPQAIKELGDMVTEGKLLQDYAAFTFRKD